MREAGGKVISLSWSTSPGICTHIVGSAVATAATLSHSSGMRTDLLQALARCGNGDSSSTGDVPTPALFVKQQWLADCVQAGAALPVPHGSPYLLPDPSLHPGAGASVVVVEGEGDDDDTVVDLSSDPLPHLRPAATAAGLKRGRPGGAAGELDMHGGSGKRAAGGIQHTAAMPNHPPFTLLPAALPSPDPCLPTPIPYPSHPLPAPALAVGAGIGRLPPWAIHPSLDVTRGKLNTWLLTSTRGLETADISAAKAEVVPLPTFSSAHPPTPLSSSSSSSPFAQAPFHAPNGCPHAAIISAVDPASLGTCAFAALYYPPPASSSSSSGAGTGALQEGRGEGQVQPSSRIFALDIDGTVLKPSNPKSSFCAAADDWVLLDHPRSPSRVITSLQQAHSAGYKVVLFSNQAGVGKGHTSLATVCARVDAFARAAGVPMQAFLAVSGGGDVYRKPRPGMAWLLAAFCNGGVPINARESVYVGDAAGRPKLSSNASALSLPGVGSRDHSDSDATWALNQGWIFTTTEALFLGSSAARDKDPLRVARVGKHSDPKYAGSEPVLSFIPSLSLLAPAARSVASGGVGSGSGPEGREIVLLIGPPASGKSTLCNTRFPLSAGYVRVNQDTLGTRPKCIAVAQAALAGQALPLPPSVLDSPECPVPAALGGAAYTAGRPCSVVVDATNLSPAVRAEWVQCARKEGVPIRALFIEVSKATVLYLNEVRGCGPRVAGQAAPRSVPDVAIHGMFKSQPGPPGGWGAPLEKARAAAAAEGFASYEVVQFMPGPYCDIPAPPAGGSSSSSTAAEPVVCDACAMQRALLYCCA